MLLLITPPAKSLSELFREFIDDRGVINLRIFDHMNINDKIYDSFRRHK